MNSRARMQKTRDANKDGRPSEGTYVVGDFCSVISGGPPVIYNVLLLFEVLGARLQA